MADDAYRLLWQQQQKGPFTLLLSTPSREVNLTCFGAMVRPGSLLYFIPSGPFDYNSSRPLIPLEVPFPTFILADGTSEDGESLVIYDPEVKGSRWFPLTAPR